RPFGGRRRRFAARLDGRDDIDQISAVTALAAAHQRRLWQRAFGRIAAADSPRHLLHLAAATQVLADLAVQLAAQIGFSCRWLHAGRSLESVFAKTRAFGSKDNRAGRRACTVAHSRAGAVQSTGDSPDSGYAC